MSLPPPTKSKPLKVRATKRSGTKEILVFGQRDPRGPDNNTHIWADGDDKLHRFWEQETPPLVGGEECDPCL